MAENARISFRIPGDAADKKKACRLARFLAYFFKSFLSFCISL